MADQRPPRARRVAATVAALVPVSLVAGVGLVLAAYTATTTNPNNSIATGTVAISDNDGANVAMYTAAADGGLGPNQSITRCLTVTYTGSLDADVRLYATSPITNGDKFTLTVERDETPGGGAFPSCAGFGATSTALPTADLGAMPSTYDAGITANPPGTLTTGQQVAYRFTITAKDDPTPGARATAFTTADHAFTWEARTQDAGPSASSSQLTFPPSNAFDNNASTFWVSSGSSAADKPTPTRPETLTTVFTAPRPVSSVSVSPRLTYGPKGFRIDGLVNGRWQTLNTVTQADAPATHSVPTTTVTGIRLVITDSYSTSNTQVVQLTPS